MSSKPSTGPGVLFTCPLCNTVVDPDNSIQDPRWSNPVHARCLHNLESWPKHAKNPLGKYGTEDWRS